MLKYKTGTFTVDSLGKIEVDYLFDGGWFQEELGIFNLKEMDGFEPDSTEFILKAVQRVSTGSNLGHIVIKDDVVLSIERAEPIGICAIADIITDDQNWLETEVGAEVLAYGDNADL